MTHPLTKSFPLVLAVLALLPASTRAQNFTFPNFSSSAGLKINGNATAPAVGQDGVSSVLRLTPNLDNQAGSAFSLNTVQLGGNASFSTAFSFQMWGGSGISDGTGNPPGADGFTFVLNTQSNSVGALGQGVGYQGVADSVGIKFDTWDDSTANGFPQDNDPNGNFVAIYTDGSTHLSSNSAPNNAYNTPGDATAFYTPPDLMKNGQTWFAWVDYDGSSDDLQVRLSETDVRPTSPDLSEIVDLNSSTILGSSPAVYAGFTSGTGGANDNNDILNWQFNDTYNPITRIPSSVPDQGPGVILMAILFLGMGALTVWGSKRRLRA